jgi:hypothetical protein
MPSHAILISPAGVDLAGNVAGTDTGSGFAQPIVRRPVFGGQRGGLHYAPDTAYDAPSLRDLIVYLAGPSGFPYPVGFVASSHPLDNVSLPSLLPGELLLKHKSGSSIKLNDDGSITITPAANKSIHLGGDTGLAGVAVVGSSVSVSLSTGNGTVTSGSAFTQSK